MPWPKLHVGSTMHNPKSVRPAVAKCRELFYDMTRNVANCRKFFMTFYDALILQKTN